MPTITVEMVREFNQRLVARGAPVTIAEREYPDAFYDQNLIAQPKNSVVAPLIIDEITYTNCGSLQQSVTASVEKTVTNSVTLTTQHSVKIGLTAKFKVLVVETEIEAEYNFERTEEQATTEEIAYKFETPLDIPPMKRVVFQAVVQQEKVSDVPFKLVVMIKGGKVATVPKGLARLQRWWNGTDHFYTINIEHPEDVGYTEEGSPGYIFSSQVSGTEPLYRYFNGTDHFYTADFGELGKGAHGWDLEGIAGYVYRHAQPNTVPVHRYWNGTDHFYTSDFAELGEARHGYKREGEAFHIVPQSIAENGALQDVVALFPTLAERTFEISGTFRGEATVRQASILLHESEATSEECQILGSKFGGGAARSARSAGLYEVRTPASELVGKTPLTPSPARSIGVKPIGATRTPTKGPTSKKPPRRGR